MNTYKKFLRNFYLSSFFYDFIFAYAIYTAYFNIRGLSVFQISLLLSWWALTSVLLEIPTGALADRWSRKKMLTIAPLFKALCFVIWFFANGNIYLYGLGFVFWSLGSTFVSGTAEALLYDATVFYHNENEYEKVLGKKRSYFHLAIGISIVCGGLIANYNLNWAILLSVIPLLLSSFFAHLIKEMPKVKSTEEVHYLDYIKIAYREIKASNILLYLFVYLTINSILVGGLEEFNQLYYQLVKLPLFLFGVAGFLWSTFNALGSYYAYRLKRFSFIYHILPLISGACLILVARFPSIPMVGILLLSYLVASPLRVLMESKVQQNIQSQSRATVTSASSLLINLSGVVLSPLFGLIAKIWNLPALFLATGIIMLLFAMWALAVKNKLNPGRSY